jgi:ferric-dicitrate binding protein FerR (iron transport regulator)
MTLDIQKLKMSTDAREAAQAAFDALQDWRNEILAVNERYLIKAVDQLTKYSSRIGLTWVGRRRCQGTIPEASIVHSQLRATNPL